jgi:hypothetical protein
MSKYNWEDRSWEELGFDVKKDGKWATVDEIKKRIAQKQKEAFRIKLFIFSGVVLTGIFLSLLIWLLL